MKRELPEYLYTGKVIVTHTKSITLLEFLSDCEAMLTLEFYRLISVILIQSSSFSRRTHAVALKAAIP